MISDSLLARASTLPASSAATVGRSPTAPVMPLRTTSHVQPGRLDRGVLPQPVEGRGELGDLLLEELLLRPAGGQPDHPEPVGVGPDHVEGLGADRARWTRG